ncbi:MAG: signal recognition particle-docking protein FtsY [Acidobacteriota bacterium]|nr:MAG: signal recognition particle-docking protein FtsY [Acidobacteriota bacterium]
MLFRRSRNGKDGSPGLRERLRRGLARTRSRLGAGLRRLAPRGRRVDDALLDEVEELLVEADLGVDLATELREVLAREARGRELTGPEALAELVRRHLVDMLPAPSAPRPVAEPPRVTLVVGVNGSGKTTTTGKLAARWAADGRRVTVAAADTFRAAAVEQLVAWAERAGAQVVRSQPGADPAAVAFDAARAARARGADELLVDTAGRLHNRKPLMDELAKIGRAVAKEIPEAPHETLLVLDGTVGRNAIEQARQFARVVPVTGLVLTKLDGTARGGVAVAIGRELGLPVRYVGVGEGIDDLLDFDVDEYLEGLLAPDGDPQAAEAGA